MLLVDRDESSIENAMALASRELVRLHVARSATEAVTLARCEWLDGAIIAVEPAGEPAALKLARELKAIGSGAPPLPVAVLKEHVSLADRWQAVPAGVAAFLSLPLAGDELWATAQKFAALRRTAKPRVLVVASPLREQWEWLCLLDDTDVELAQVTAVEDVVAKLEDRQPDLLVLALDGSKIDAIALTQVLRSYPLWQDLSLLVVAEHATADFEVSCYAHGVDDVVVGPAAPVELAARIRARVMRVRLLRDRANMDALTGLLSRRGFAETLRTRFAHAQRHRRLLTVGLIDLDDFKGINDRFGHFAGDRVLHALGAMLRNQCRAGDVSARLGGDEFIVAFDGEEREATVDALRRLLDHFHDRLFFGDGELSFHATFTAGVATAPRDADGQESLLRVADRRLYTGKRAGKNCVVP